MSSITPASFVDDGGSFHKRIPRGLHPTHISRWLDSADSETTSAYTGSYIDDGADMLLPSSASPGFGKVDPRFYKQRKRRSDEKIAAWNDDIQKAVAGDIGRSLEKMRNITGVEVKRADGTSGAKDEKKKHKRKETVTIPLPPKWGTFIIKSPDGRVIVVDEHGEFDSGLPQAQPQPEEVGQKWVKAPSSLFLPSSPPSSSSPRKHRSRKHRLPSPLKSLTPIPESTSEYEDEDAGYIPSGGEDLLSPTGFFMTGGKDGWPARSPVTATSPVRSRSRHSCTDTDSLVMQKKKQPVSPVRSPPGGWPVSPGVEGSVTMTSVSSESGSRRSRRSERRVGSVKSYSTYRPATVEDAPDTSSENPSVVKKGEAWGQPANPSDDGWGGSKKGGEKGWGRSREGSEKGWGGSNKASESSCNNNKASITSSSKSSHSRKSRKTHQSTITAPQPQIQNWISNRVKTISQTSSPPRTRRTSRAPSENTWDGYELPKTLSEASVAGTGSVRSSLAGNSQRTTSERWESEVGWGGSQGAIVDGWGGERTDSGSSNAGGSRGGYKNGYDEDDETYLNDSWSGVRVRVRKTRRGSGWER